MLNEAFTYPEFTEITELPSYTVTYTGSDGTEKSTTLTATDHYLTGEATAPKMLQFSVVKPEQQK